MVSSRLKLNIQSSSSSAWALSFTAASFLFLACHVDICHNFLDQGRGGKWRQKTKIEAKQKTTLKKILADKYTDYDSAMKFFHIDTLHDRRQKHMLKFAKKCSEDLYNKHMFPLNSNTRGKEKYNVNFARTSQYFNSAIPQCQRMLNMY